MIDESTPADTESLVRRGLKALAGLGFGSPPAAGVTTTVDSSLGRSPASDLLLDLDDPEQRRLGDYELLELAGQGGMGVVYRARQLSLDREVAVKLLAVGPWARVDFAERFRGEAKSAARMQHPNIVAIHEIGEHQGTPYFSMQYIAGTSLDALLRERGPMSPADAARLVRTLAEAVDYAHQLNVLHLDLKPGNVLIESAGGRPLIADFGLARPIDQALAASGDEISGTPSFMAPEQVQLREHGLSRATDLYGLGAILYQALTGRPPFTGADADEILRRVVDEPPLPPGRLVRGIPRDLDAICLNCLAKSPGQRYASARSLADDLIRFLDGHPISIRRPGLGERLLRWYRQEPISFGGIATAFLVLGTSLAGLVWLYVDRDARIRQVDFAAAAIATAMVEAPKANDDDRRREWMIQALAQVDSSASYASDQAVLLSATAAHLQERQQTGQARAVQYAALEKRIVAERGRWISALERRGSAAALLEASYLLLGEHDRRDQDLRSAAEAGRDDADVLFAIASFCDFQAHDTCETGSIHARIAELAPNDIAAAMAAAVRDRTPIPATLRRLQATLQRPGAHMVDHADAVIRAIRGELRAVAQELDRVDPLDGPTRASAIDLVLLRPIDFTYSWEGYSYAVWSRCTRSKGGDPALIDRATCRQLAERMAADSHTLSYRYAALVVLAETAESDDERSRLTAERKSLNVEMNDLANLCCRLPEDASFFVDTLDRDGQISATRALIARRRHSGHETTE